MEGLKALVVDDDPSINSLMTELLRHWGCDAIQIASDGVSAVRKSSQFCPDLVLMDLDMPEMNGYQAATLIREQIPGVVIVMVTGMAQGNLARKALEDKVVQAVVSKPFKFEQLRVTLQEALKDGRRRSGAGNEVVVA